MSTILEQDIKYIPGVGPNRKEILNKELGIHTWGDLLEYYPYKYVDRSKIYAIKDLQGSMPYVQVKGKILSFEEFSIGARKKGVVAHLSDGCGVVDLVWFQHTKYVYQNYKVNTEYIVFGKPTVYNGRYQFAHPDIDKAEDLQLSEMGLQPYYSTTETMKKRGCLPAPSRESSSRSLKSSPLLFQRLSHPISLTRYIYVPEMKRCIISIILTTPQNCNGHK